METQSFKTCARCGQAYALSTFGTQRYCRDCWRAYDRARRAKRRELKRAKERYEYLLDIRGICRHNGQPLPEGLEEKVAKLHELLRQEKML